MADDIAPIDQQWMIFCCGKELSIHDTLEQAVERASWFRSKGHEPTIKVRTIIPWTPVEVDG